ncbi:MAG: hypothetical protein ABR509_07565 [Candidatus Limnocylindria bacterium]
MTSTLRAGFDALQHRNYRLYQGSQFISLIGSWMQAVSLPWLVLELGGSPLHLAMVVALQFGSPSGRSWRARWRSTGGAVPPSSWAGWRSEPCSRS